MKKSRNFKEKVLSIMLSLVMVVSLCVGSDVMEVRAQEGMQINLSELTVGQIITAGTQITNDSSDYTCLKFRDYYYEQYLAFDAAQTIEVSESYVADGNSNYNIYSINGEWEYWGTFPDMGHIFVPKGKNEKVVDIQQNGILQVSGGNSEPYQIDLNREDGCEYYIQVVSYAGMEGITEEYIAAFVEQYKAGVIGKYWTTEDVSEVEEICGETTKVPGEAMVLVFQMKDVPENVAQEDEELRLITGGAVLSVGKSDAVVYNVGIDESISNGEVYASVNYAEAGEEVELTATADAGWAFESWEVLDENVTPITVTDNKFTMPNGNVTVSATFVENEIEETIHSHNVCADSECAEHAAANWKAVTTLPTEAGYYYLAEDIEITEAWEPADGTFLCLNGKVLSLAEGEEQSVITVNSGRHVTITDCTETVHKFTVDNNLWKLDEENGTETVIGGVITGGSGQGEYSKVGGGVCINGTEEEAGPTTSFNMYGGNIVGNVAESGAGVYVAGGYADATFNMYGGSVVGNQAAAGAGVYAEYAMAYISISGDALVGYNYATDGYGGGVYAYRTDGISLSENALIKGNKVVGNDYGGGAGVFAGDSDMHMSGNATITENSFVEDTVGIAGGVYLWNSDLFVADEVKIVDNTVAGVENNVELIGVIYSSLEPATGGFPYITLNGALTGEAAIGVTIATEDYITSGWATYMNAADAKYIFSDNSEYKVIRDGDELRLDEAVSTIVIDEIEIAVDESKLVAGETVEWTGAFSIVGDAEGYRIDTASYQVVDNTEGGVATTVFKEGNEYLVCIPIVAEEGYEISNSLSITANVAGDFSWDSGCIKYCFTAKAPEHTHDWSDTWTSDENGHWHKCKVEGCTQNGDSAPHTYEWYILKEATDIENGLMKAYCNVCGYENEEMQEIPFTAGDVLVENNEENDHEAKLVNENDVKGKVPLTEQEKQDVLSGSDLSVILLVKDVDVDADTAGKQEIVEALDDKTLGTFLDIELVKKLDGVEVPITGTNGMIQISFVVPEQLRNTVATVDRSFSILRQHDGVEICNSVYDNETNIITFETDKFSEYALVYVDSINLDSDYDTCAKDENCPIYPYTDAIVTAWYHDGVHYCLDNGIMTGNTSEIFKPNDNISRAMIVTMLWSLEGKPVVDYDMTFEDVEDGMWYEEAVRWAASNDVVAGYSASEFGPNDFITREQLAVILRGYAVYKNFDVSRQADLSGYEDAHNTSDWALTAMKWVCDEGIISGKSDTILDPLGNATRAEAATMFYRFCENIVK